MSYENGRFPDSALAAIPGGRLTAEAAAAWNAGPAKAGLYPTGPNSSYRTFEKQEEYYDLYINHGGNLAAVPGTSNHGWGVAVDLAAPWMADWMKAHGAAYGWQKTEAFSEWWHYNYVGGYTAKPTFKNLQHGSRGPRVVKLTRKLAYLHRPDGKAYLGRRYWKFKDPVVEAVKTFQHDHKLGSDGVVGPHTFHQIQTSFDRQYKHRH